MAGNAALVMPKLGLTMTEGLLVEWKAEPGRSFRAGEVLFVVETDKIANEIEAEADGQIAEILVPAGETVLVGTALARLAGETVSATAVAPPRGRIVATPLARRLAKQRGLDLSVVTGSGPQGRIKAADLPAPAAAAAPLPAPVKDKPAKLDGTQATVARRLQEAKREIPHFYLTQPADLGALLDLKARVDALGTWGRTTLTHWLLAAVGRTLVDQPAADRVWTEDGPLALGTSDVGLAVDGERGLYVPVVRDVGRLPLGEIAAATRSLVEKARVGRVPAADSAGGSISLSNLGMYGIATVTPIINPGQAMILGVGALQSLFRPDAEGRAVAVREVTLALAADHRIINGAAAAAFLGGIVGYLQAPLRLLVPPVTGKNT